MHALIVRERAPVRRGERPRRAGGDYLPRSAAQTSIRGVVTSVPALV